MTNLNTYVRNHLFNLIAGKNTKQLPVEMSGLFEELVEKYSVYILRSVDADVAYLQVRGIENEQTPVEAHQEFNSLYDVMSQNSQEADKTWDWIEEAYGLLREEFQRTA